VHDFEGEAFAGELHSLVPAPRPRTWTPRLAAAIRTGIIAGFLPAAGVGLVYFVQNMDQPLPWLKIASILVVYGPAVGVMLAVLVEALVMMFDRIARVGFGLVAVFNPVSAGALGGSLAGIAPGAVGVLVFGAYHGPFVGTPSIACALIAGSVMIAIPLARRARLARAPNAQSSKRAIAMATIFATLILCAVAAIVAPIIVESAFQQAQGAIDDYGGAIIGAVAGMLGGCVVGVYIGLVIAFGRALHRAPSSRPGNR
jgi:hypothetical protein